MSTDKHLVKFPKANNVHPLPKMKRIIPGGKICNGGDKKTFFLHFAQDEALRPLSMLSV